MMTTNVLYVVTILGINRYDNETIDLRTINIDFFDIKNFVITCLSLILTGGLIDVVLLKQSSLCKYNGCVKKQLVKTQLYGKARWIVAYAS